MIRLQKKSALCFVQKWTPLYADVFSELKQDGGRVQFGGRYTQMRSNIGSYVQLYDDERMLGAALMLGLLGEEKFWALNEEAKEWGKEEQLALLEEVASDEAAESLANSFEFPETDEDWDRALQEFNALSEEERGAQSKQGAYFWGGFFAQFFNTLSLMTHGAKLTTLVPRAIAGDKDAFLKAVQVDRMLLQHHPYFVERKQQAQDNGEQDFLMALAYRECNPNLKGKIRYPALYMLFGLLESIGWLDDLVHSEILDLCDACGLDRYQNRIEDVGYITKRLLDYREFQKTGGMSMQ